MQKSILGLAVLLTAAHGVQAEPVLLSENVLNLGDAIVVEGSTTRFYQQVELELTKEGDFRVLGGVEKSLATVTEKSVNIVATAPLEVELVVSGYMANPCIQLETAVTRKGSTFYAVFAQTPLQTLVACVQVLEPFSTTVALDVKDLSSGTYTVQVNGEQISFLLE
mgnify:FL=1